MSLWWLEPEWTKATCPQCGNQIWPDGDPDWGMCYDCMRSDRPAEEYPEQPHDSDVDGEVKP